MVKPSVRRRAFTFATAAAAFGLGGCAGPQDDKARPPAATGNALLTPWLAIDGGWRADPRQPIQVAPATGPRLRFVQPVGVAALGDLLLVADAGARTVWRIERGRDAMAPFAPFTGGSAGHGASLHVASDLSVWIALPAEHQVVQYDARGRLVRRFRDEASAPRPVAVVAADSRAEIFVGDGATAQVTVFDPLGRTVRVLGGGRIAALQSIAAMALGPEGLYVLDPLAQQVVVLGRSGEVAAVIGENQLLRPRGLAVDRSGRVFVGDEADQRIKVFRGTDLVATAGGSGGGAGRFGRIEALAVDGNMLYVADSVGARVQVLLVAPPSLERRGAGS
jgi:sugar lactone lactonase YvrE